MLGNERTKPFPRKRKVEPGGRHRTGEGRALVFERPRPVPLKRRGLPWVVEGCSGLEGLQMIKSRTSDSTFFPASTFLLLHLRLGILGQLPGSSRGNNTCLLSAHSAPCTGTAAPGESQTQMPGRRRPGTGRAPQASARRSSTCRGHRGRCFSDSALVRARSAAPVGRPSDCSRETGHLDWVGKCYN